MLKRKAAIERQSRSSEYSKEIARVRDITRCHTIVDSKLRLYRQAMIISLEGIDIDLRDVDLSEDTIHLNKIVRLFDGDDQSSDSASDSDNSSSEDDTSLDESDENRKGESRKRSGKGKKSGEKSKKARS